MEYQKTAKQYAELYGRSERTVKRWKAQGWPLDDEEQTRALIAQGNTSADSDTPGVSAPRPEGKGEVGLSAAISRLQKAELDAHAAFVAACEAGNESVTAQRLKQWNQITEQLRKVEESTPEVEEANKNSVSLGELKRDLSDLFAQLRQDLEALPRRVAKELAGKDEVSIREGVAREIAAVIQNLYDCRYLEGVSDEG